MCLTVNKWGKNGYGRIGAQIDHGIAHEGNNRLSYISFGIYSSLWVGNGTFHWKQQYINHKTFCYAVKQKICTTSRCYNIFASHPYHHVYCVSKLIRC